MSDYWRLRGLLGLTLLVLPWVLLVTILRPSLSLLGWLTSCLWLALLLGLAMQSFTGRTNLPLARRLPPLSLVALAALCLQLLVFPAEVLFWLPEEWYAPVQLVAALGGVAVVVGLVRLVRTTVVPPTSPRSLAEALAELGRLPDGGRGRYGRRLRRWLAEQVGRQTLVDRLRSAVVHRTAVLGRYLAVAVVVAVAAVVQLVLTRGAFVEGWVALLVGLALAAETRVYLWRREGVLDGFVEPDPWAGRTLYDAWWGASAGMALVVTLRTSAVAGGLRPEPVGWYLVVFALALVAAMVPFRWAARRQEQIFVTWLARHPERVAELRGLEQDWPPQGAPFGEWPRLPRRSGGSR